MDTYTQFTVPITQMAIPSVLLARAEIIERMLAKGIPMTLPELHEKLSALLNNAKEDAEESHKLAPNSYGAGYDAGFYQALKDVIGTLETHHEC